MIYSQASSENKGGSKNAPKSDSHEYFDDCNIIIPRDVVVLDIDDTLSISDMEGILGFYGLKTFMVETEEGIHVWFKRPDGYRAKSTYNSKIGIEIETKTNTKVPQGINFKRNGIARTTFNEDCLDNLPTIPIALMPCKSKEKLYGMGDGDGRHNALLKHMLNIPKDEKNDISHIINNFVFAAPLEDTDINGINDFQGRDIDMFDVLRVADEMMVKYSTCVYNKRFYHRVNNSHYKSDEDEFIHIIATNYPHLFAKDHAEIIKQCKAKSKRIDVECFPVNLKNGHIINGTFKPFLYTGFTPFYIDYEYKEECEKVEIIDDFLNHISDNDEEYREYILKMFAYPLIYDFSYKAEKALFFILTGDGGNGKGTCLKLLRSLYGKDNSSTNGMEDMTDGSKIVMMRDKLINLGDDIEDIPINQKMMKILKNITTADIFTSRDLYEKASSSPIAPTMIFTSNHRIKSFEKGRAFKRRVVWLPMFGKPKATQTNFINDITSEDAVTYLLSLIVKVLPTVYNDGMGKCTKVEEYTQEYHKFNNNILMFLDDIDIEDYYDTKFKALYEDYKVWHEDAIGDENPLSMKLVRDTVENTLGIDCSKVKNIQGKTMRVIAPRDEDGDIDD